MEVVIGADQLPSHIDALCIYAGGIVSTIPLLMSWCGGVMQDAALRREVAENGLTSKFQSKFQIKLELHEAHVPRANITVKGLTI